MITRNFRRMVEAVARSMMGLPRFVPLQAALTSTSWDGDAYSTTGATEIDLSAVFGVPANIKAVLIAVTARDSGSAANDCWISLTPGTSNAPAVLRVSGLPNDSWRNQEYIVPCDNNGDITYAITASGVATFDVYLQVWGYWI